MPSLRSSSLKINTVSFGFCARREIQQLMAAADQHNEIELNYIESGEMVLERGGEPIRVPAGTFLVYWAAIPHQVISVKARTRINWCILPVSRFLSWELPQPFSDRLLGGEVLRYTEKFFGRTEPPFAKWAADFATRSDELCRVVGLEMEAFFRRLAVAEAPRPGSLTRSPSQQLTAQCGHVEKMADHMIRHFREPLSVSQIAEAVGLNAEYAMRLFQKRWKLTIGNFLLQQRLAEAKRLLLLGDGTLATIAFASGFQSLSRFYAVFQQACGCSPGEYRRRLTEWR